MNQKTAWVAGAVGSCVLILFGALAANMLNPSPVPNTPPIAEQQPSPVQKTSAGSSPRIHTAVSTAQALAIVRQTAPKAKISATPELVNYAGTVAYEVLANTGKFYVDAQNGRLLAKPAPQLHSDRPQQYYARGLGSKITIEGFS